MPTRAGGGVSGKQVGIAASVLLAGGLGGFSLDFFGEYVERTMTHNSEIVYTAVTTMAHRNSVLMESLVTCYATCEGWRDNTPPPPLDLEVEALEFGAVSLTCKWVDEHDG